MEYSVFDPAFVKEMLVTDLIGIGTIEQERVVNGTVFPLTLVPKSKNVNYAMLQEYLLKHHELIRQAISHHGAILFKGFDVVNGQEFSSIINCTGLKETVYTTGAAIRRIIVGSEDRMENP